MGGRGKLGGDGWSSLKGKKKEFKGVLPEEGTAWFAGVLHQVKREVDKMGLLGWGFEEHRWKNDEVEVGGVEENRCRSFVRVVIKAVKSGGKKIILCLPGVRKGEGWPRLWICCLDGGDLLSPFREL